MARVLIADDEANLRATVARTLRGEGHEPVEAADGVEAVSRLRRGGIDVVLLDLSMPRLDGFGVLQALAEEEGAPPVIVLTAHASLDNAVRAVKLGAWDFVEKPPAAETLLLRIERALEAARRREEEARGGGPLERIVGSSAAIRRLRETIAQIAPTGARVLVVGENGTGKELVARALHELSPRAAGPFVRLNCAAVPVELFESELFGHVRGAFTGAVGSRRGRFERASGGTLLLDEIGEMPLAVQPKLLRALEEGEIERLGAERGIRVDARVIASTNRDLARMVREGRFREDLYYRLEVVTIEVPPLRHRREDIPELARHLLRAACRETGRREVPELTADALERLRREDWPGNVRQLRNVMERVAILVRGPRVDADALAPHLSGSAAFGDPDRGPLAEAVAAFERRFIQRALERHGGNVAAAARELEIERSSLYRKMRAMGLRPSR
ncbi:MAG: sigma-54-dependent Fis family transcriptional regulator [Acidobacteria bacterium]|nr:MAG: sigma-54-dependent Fis family transcriptional regulator [Acidobacteriota bacterium]